MEIGEQGGRATERKSTGAVQDVTLEQRSDPWPVGRERDIPEPLHLIRYAVCAAGRIGVDLVGRGRDLVRVLPKDGHIVTHLIRRSGPDPLELLVEHGEWRLRRGSNEVRHVPPRRRNGQEQTEVETIYRPPPPGRPRDVKGVLGRVLQGAHGENELPDRAEGEPRLGEVLGA